ncbi:MAG: homoserine dehydrogenase [Anaerolineae bacterium]|nr:homoserine dehydrogenase [Phycisphaerae bacterium]
MATPVGITLLGCGIVGSGVIRILNEQRELLQRRTGLVFEVRHVVVRDLEKHKAQSSILPFTTDVDAALNDPRVTMVVELIGGVEDANTHVEKALRIGTPVVTANKSLLASRGPELFALARANDTCIAFEASCGGGIPIINALSHGLIANRIDALVGIVNGTCNVILTRMTKNGWSYEQALAEAQKAGFAEADPTLDISGRDAAQKLALLASLAFNVRITERDIHVEGIESIQPQDIAFARDLGYVIKLLVIAQRGDLGSDAGSDRISLRVHPTLVHQSDVLADVSGSFNAISVYGNALGHTSFYGRGAGQMPTASAVVSDMIGVALGTTPLAFEQLKIYPDTTPIADVLPFEQLETRYYLRLSARDVPGVLAEVAEALGRNGISLSAVLQRESDEGQHVPVVITTHKAREGSMRAALHAIDRLMTVEPPTVCLRILDQPKEFVG